MDKMLFSQSGESLLSCKCLSGHEINSVIKDKCAASGFFYEVMVVLMLSWKQSYTYFYSEETQK